ncbi:MAG TPA: TonB-dependent receptor [Steroidobacteraceae bacterium]|jgi:outer membrane receptor protein involved in Fe transport|nr:TonB-dependent receptor [Steroidobacteraceae bacterium]
MTRSRRRKLSRERANTLRTIVRTGVPLASALVVAMPAARAQQAPGADTLQTIVVTAEKVQENLQNVPISVEAFDNKKLTQLNIVNLDDYVEFAPAISYVRSQGEGGNGEPGSSLLYIRGVVSGGDGNHSGSEPSVGVYLDEQPVTTITGALPLHMYDMSRLEVLEGPQGTLFGASSEAGTVRMITNKPDPTKFEAGYNVQGNLVDGGGPGDVVEGYVNLPISNTAAIRLVAWQEHDGGYISNVAGTDANGCIFNGVRTFPTWAQSASGVGPGGGTGACTPSAPIGAGAISNATWREKNYNTADTHGGRAALKLDLGDNWTITPSFQGQSEESKGSFGYDPAVGPLELVHFGPDSSHDTWTQSALTIEGKVHDFDIVYAGGYVKRNQHSVADYADYSEFYDKVNGSGAYYVGNSGQPIMPQQFVLGGGDFEMWSQELRVTTPLDEPVHGTAGVFLQRQMHNIWQLYTMPGYGWTNINGGNPNGFGYVAPNDYSVPGFPNAIWLTDEQRVDRDRAAFAQGTWDINSHLSLTGGVRFYKYDNSLIGYYGFNSTFSSSEGVATCFEPATVKNAPCNDLDARTSATGSVPKVNLSYNIVPGKMVYATYSKGFRPGGVNRVGGNIPYAADFLTNYEVGWKTQWLNNTLRWNGAFFWEDWKNFQFSFLGANSVTIIRNGGSARIKGVETSVDWLPESNFLVSTNFTLLDPVLTENYYGCIPGTPECTPLPPVQTPAGTNLPVTPKFKGNVILRYSLMTIDNWKPYWQVAGMYQSTTSPVLLVSQNNVLGNMPAYALVNVKLGADSANGMRVDFFISNILNRNAQLSRYTESNPSLDNQIYIVPVQPRTFGIEFGQDF